MNESRRGFLGRLMAGGFGLAVGQAVTIQPATAQEQELLKAPMILPPFPSDVQAYCMRRDPPTVNECRLVVHHLNVDFYSFNEEAMRELFQALHMRRFDLQATATSQQPRIAGIVGV